MAYRKVESIGHQVQSACLYPFMYQMESCIREGERVFYILRYNSLLCPPGSFGSVWSIRHLSRVSRFLACWTCGSSLFSFFLASYFGGVSGHLGHIKKVCTSNCLLVPITKCLEEVGLGVYLLGIANLAG